MPRGETYINGKDAYAEWGMSLEDTGLSELMAPPAAKDRISNESRLEHGARVMAMCERVAARELSLPFHITAPDRRRFLARYAALCEELGRGTLDIETAWQPGVVYHCLYQSCSQFTQFMMGIAKFTLKLTEPNPADRL